MNRIKHYRRVATRYEKKSPVGMSGSCQCSESFSLSLHPASVRLIPRPHGQTHLVASPMKAVRPCKSYVSRSIRTRSHETCHTRSPIGKALVRPRLRLKDRASRMRTMVKRTWFWAVVFGCFVLMALPLLQRDFQQTRAERITKGMAKEEVIEIMGREPPISHPFSRPDGSGELCEWSTSYANVIVEFKNNHVCFRSINQRERDNVFQRVARRALRYVNLIPSW